MYLPVLHTAVFGCVTQQIHYGLLDTDQLLQRYCSSIDPPPLTTTGPYANVRFHSDVALADRGFSISYTALQGHICSWLCLRHVVLLMVSQMF